MSYSAKERKDLHFTRRWQERGLPSIDPWAVVDYLNDEYFRPNHGELEFVTTGNYVNTSIYRFFAEGIPFYVVIDENTGYLVTLYNQQQMRKIKRARKRRKRRR